MAIYDYEDEDYRYVLGLDPGGTTGVAMLRYTETTAPELIYLHQIEDGKVGFKEWFQGSAIGPDLDIASEKWVERNVKGADRTPLVIEGVQYALWDDEITYQEPSMKSLVPDEFLKRENLWVEGKRHAMDALIHALVFLRNNDHRPTLEALAGDTSEPIAEPGEAEEAVLGEGEQPADGFEEDAMAQAMAEAMQALQDAEEAAEAAQEAMEAMAEAMGEAQDAEAEAEGRGEGEATGTGSWDDGEGIEWTDPEIKGDRKRRQRNGVFAGFEPEDSGTEKSLLDD